MRIQLLSILLLPLIAADFVPPPAQINNPPILEPGMTEYARGLEQLAAFELNPAEQSFAAALKLAPSNSEFVLAHGMSMLLSTERMDQGRAEIERATSMTQTPSRQLQNMYGFSRYLANDRTGGRRRFEGLKRNEFEEMVRTIGEEATFGPSRREGAIQRLPSVAKGFAAEQQQAEAMNRFFYARGMQRKQQGDAVGACNDLERVVALYPDDWTLRHFYGVALSEAGDYEGARQQISLVLRRQSALAQGYAQRAIASARMGNIRQAKQDLEIVKLLDPNDSLKLQIVTVTQKVIAECEASLPKEPAAQLFAKLLDAARANQSIEQLLPAAKTLIKAAHASRLNGEEVYQERLRKFQWALMGKPRDPGALSDLGRFLLDEIDVRGEYVDPGMHWTYYRVQGKVMQQAEIEAARGYFNQALGIQQSHVPALMGMAEIKYRENLWGDAENYVRNAMFAKPDDPFILDMMSKLMRIAAGQQMSRALARMTPDRWTEYGDGYETHWVSYPTGADYAAAEQFGRNADGLLGQAKAYIQKALQSLKDTPESYDYVGTLAFEKKDYEPARKAYEKAVEKVPQKLEYRYGLANAYARLNLFDAYLEQTTVGRGMEQTSVAAHLLGAWQRIVGANWSGASDLLQKAIAIDPGDSRIHAYMGAVAEAQDKADEALACFRAALAMEEANAGNRGCSYLAATGLWDIDSISRSVALRMRIARLIEDKDPKSAADLYSQNLKLEARLNGRDFLQRVPAAMLPEGKTANQPNDTSIGGLMYSSRGLLGVALYRMNQFPQAAEQFRQLSSYQGIVQRNRRIMTETLGGGMWTRENIAQTAVNTFQRVGDEPMARLWQRNVQSQTAEENVPARRSPPPARGMTMDRASGPRR